MDKDYHNIHHKTSSDRKFYNGNFKLSQPYNNNRDCNSIAYAMEFYDNKLLS